jgi:excisionase family DNA binding protein
MVYTLAEVAQLLKVGEETIRREVQRGNITALRVGKQYRMTRSDLIGWLGRERFIEIFQPFEAFTSLIGAGGLDEEEATELATKLVHRARSESP